MLLYLLFAIITDLPEQNTKQSHKACKLNQTNTEKKSDALVVNKGS